jgi:hypothetical protein
MFPQVTERRGQPFGIGERQRAQIPMQAGPPEEIDGVTTSDSSRSDGDKKKPAGYLAGFFNALNFCGHVKGSVFTIRGLTIPDFSSCVFSRRYNFRFGTNHAEHTKRSASISAP